MFERFTDEARRVVVAAQEHARMLGHDYIGTEHLLLGLADEGYGMAAEALQSAGITPAAVRQQVEQLIGRGSHPSADIPFTDGARAVLQQADREARALRHEYIGTEHILLGLVREGDGVAAQVLMNLGAGPDRVRQRLTERLGEAPGRPFARFRRSRRSPHR